MEIKKNLWKGLVGKRYIREGEEGRRGRREREGKKRSGEKKGYIYRLWNHMIQYQTNVHPIM
jgi:hypothetical protein